MPQLIVSVEGVEINHLYLQKDKTTLGRKLHNDLVLDNMVVSGEHCVFELHGLADVLIEDLHSTNGTYINGQMIKSRQKLQDHDVIAIGQFRILFLVASAHEKPVLHDETTGMPLGSLDALGFQGHIGQLQASLTVLSGSSIGLEVPLVKTVSIFGQPGLAVVSISRRRDGYYVSHLEGDQPSTLNGGQIDRSPVLLANHDVIELAGMALELVLKNR